MEINFSPVLGVQTDFGNKIDGNASSFFFVDMASDEFNAIWDLFVI